ncbi:hypothetical protein CFC21_036204 [Triticum aestivum]|uniref:Uncharacterized protein n=2 Tax=Triticum aestivum TaxID=4565 RepID=A0A3B6EIR4_WHEAT|nr:hypothetical protein CFC21_036204 [Triticum aestivum]
MAARVGAVVLCMLLIVSAGLVATPTEARAVPDVVYAAAAGGGIRRGRWNSARRLEGDAARKREVPGGPDPQHHH